MHTSAGELLLQTGPMLSEREGSRKAGDRVRVEASRRCFHHHAVSGNSLEVPAFATNEARRGRRYLENSLTQHVTGHIVGILRLVLTSRFAGSFGLTQDCSGLRYGVHPLKLRKRCFQLHLSFSLVRNRQKAVGNAGTSHLLQVPISKVVGLHGTQVFLSNV